MVDTIKSWSSERCRSVATWWNFRSGRSGKIFQMIGQAETSGDAASATTDRPRAEAFPPLGDPRPDFDLPKRMSEPLPHEDTPDCDGS